MTRPVNLFIIVVTMICTYLIPNSRDTLIVDFYFMLRVLSAVCIAAAGNIINDYFDRKVDLINKPERTYVDVSVKRRVAIISHILLNTIALVTGTIGCLSIHWFWVACPITTIFILWWYSPVLKKKFLLGNVAVSLCTAAVPLWAVCGKLQMGVMMAIIFAFITTLLREIIKDIEDMHGDKIAGYDTLAVRWGTSKTKALLNVISGVIFSLFIFLSISSDGFTRPIFFGAMAAGMTIIFFQLQRANEPKHFAAPSRTLKLVMLFGVLLLPWIYGQ